MTRITSTILVMLILLNGTVTIMQGSGLSDDIGVNLAPGVDETLQDTIDEARNGFSADGGFGETLFSLFAAGLGVMELIVQTTYAAPSMFMNLGFPVWFVIPVFAPMYVLGLLELTFMATGRDPV